MVLELGAVYKLDWDDRPIRVIAFDDNLVMYDAWWPHKGEWGLSKLGARVIYPRISTALLVSRSTYLRTEQYSNTEFKFHRPDLPLSFAQREAVSWYDPLPESEEHVRATLEASGERRSDAQSSLNTSKVYISPFGPKGGLKADILVQADNGQAFSEAELIWKAWQLQRSLLRETRITNGVGLYRAGLMHCTPSYYIWGAKSRLDEISSGNR